MKETLYAIFLKDNLDAGIAGPMKDLIMMLAWAGKEGQVLCSLHPDGSKRVLYVWESEGWVVEERPPDHVFGAGLFYAAEDGEERTDFLSTVLDGRVWEHMLRKAKRLIQEESVEEFTLRLDPKDVHYEVADAEDWATWNNVEDGDPAPGPPVVVSAKLVFDDLSHITQRPGCGFCVITTDDTKAKRYSAYSESDIKEPAEKEAKTP